MREITIHEAIRTGSAALVLEAIRQHDARVKARKEAERRRRQAFSGAVAMMMWCQGMFR